MGLMLFYLQRKMQPNPEILQNLISRILSACAPQRIILFGSAARGEMDENSDLDVLVIMPNGTHRRETAQKIYRDLFGLGFAKDIVVATEADIEQYGENPYMVFKQALLEGKELYHAAA